MRNNIMKSRIEESGKSIMVPGMKDGKSSKRSARIYGQKAKKRTDLYKTEMCRSFTELGFCKYAERCQFCHSEKELRNVDRHPKYKTVICRTFWQEGNCPYGRRCCFTHQEKHSCSKEIEQDLTELSPINLGITARHESETKNGVISSIIQPTRGTKSSDILLGRAGTIETTERTLDQLLVTDPATEVFAMSKKECLLETARLPEKQRKIVRTRENSILSAREDFLRGMRMISPGDSVTFFPKEIIEEACKKMEKLSELKSLEVQYPLPNQEFTPEVDEHLPNEAYSSIWNRSATKIWGDSLYYIGMY